MPDILVFTATYNEIGNVESWVEGVTASVPEAHLLVVDDGSPDGTGELLDQLTISHPRLRVIHRRGKAGLATAHLIAIAAALEGDFDYLVTMDADGSHQAFQIPALLEAALNADFVIGTRYRGGTHQAGVSRRILSSGANRLTRVVLPTGLSEYTTSFRVFSRPSMDVIANTEFTAGGYAFFLECVEVLFQAGLTLAEVPIDFVDRTSGKSKIPRSQIALSMHALFVLGARRRAQANARRS